MQLESFALDERFPGGSPRTLELLQLPALLEPVDPKHPGERALVTCLFADGGIDLRKSLREGASDDALRALIESTWTARRDRYSEERPEGAG
jgi:hypothetical protein